MERRSCWPLILCLIVAMIMGLLGYMHFNRELLNKLTNEIEFVEAAERETKHSIENYNLAAENTQKEMNNAEKEVKELQDEVGKLTSSKEEKDKEVKACKDSVVSNVDPPGYIDKENVQICKYLLNTTYLHNCA